MKNTFIGLILCLLLLNCAKKEEKDTTENITYIISKENIKPKPAKQSNNDNLPPPPPISNSPLPGWAVYGTNVFIIDSDSKIYYFQRPDLGFICGTETADTIPHLINLQPKDLIEIPNKNIYDFIKLNYKDDFRNRTFIASKTDTLNSKAFFDLRKSLIPSLKDRDYYFIRRTTQEEDTVLKYKKNNEYYNSENIKWDKKRIKLPLKKTNT